MKMLKKLNQDTLYQVKLKVFEGCAEYLLVNANDSDDVIGILENKELEDFE